MSTFPRSTLSRRTLLLLVPLFGCVGLVGMLWVGTNLPVTSSSLFGSLLIADLVRPALIGGALLVAAWVLAHNRRGASAPLWRGVALAAALAGGHALLGGLVLTLDRALPWPGLPDAVQPLVSLLVALGGLAALRRSFLAERPDVRALLGLGLGALISAAWGWAGALGSLPELMLALLEALAMSLLGALFIASVFRYDPPESDEQPRRVALLAAMVGAALIPTLFGVRPWAAQGSTLAVVAAAACFPATALLVLDRSQRPHHGWWATWALLFAALLPPLAFTRGAEGDWIPGGLPAATGQATLLSLGLSIALGLLLLGGRRLHTLLQHRTVASAAGIIGLAVALGVPAASGHAAFQSDTFFVVMADQLDTEAGVGIPDRSAVYHALTAHALTSQADLRATLDGAGVAYTPYYLVNGLEVEGTPMLRYQLAQRPDVARVLDSPHLRPQPPISPHLTLAEERPAPTTMPWGIAAIHAEAVWSETGITGEGIIVGTIGTGVDWTHPALRDSYLGTRGGYDYAWFDPWEGTSEPTDTNGIGTHTLGTIVGAGGIGVAPGAKWIACRSLARDLGNLAYYLDCMQFLFAPFPQQGDPFTQGDPTRGAHIVHAGFICPPWEGCDAPTLSLAITHLSDAGQLVVTGAGNAGPTCGSIGSPALAEDAVTVGATTADGALAPYSSRGPVTLGGSQHPKPDIVAPGDAILSTFPEGSFAEFDGTSMAAAHVAGVAALLWSATPSLVGDIPRTRAALTATTEPITNHDGGTCGDPRNDVGAGIVDALEAVRVGLGTR